MTPQATDERFAPGAYWEPEAKGFVPIVIESWPKEGKTRIAFRAPTAERIETVYWTFDTGGYQYRGNIATVVEKFLRALTTATESQLAEIVELRGGDRLVHNMRGEVVAVARRDMSVHSIVRASDVEIVNPHTVRMRAAPEARADGAALRAAHERFTAAVRFELAALAPSAHVVTDMGRDRSTSEPAAPYLIAWVVFCGDIRGEYVQAWRSTFDAEEFRRWVRVRLVAVGATMMGAKRK